MSSRVFISYRRGDSSGHAGRIYDQLSTRFGDGQVFMDVDAIEPGVDFVDYIADAVGSCDVLVAVIGPDWLDASGPDGRTRLEDPHDFVRLEVSTALERDVRVIPVLVEGAAIPSERELPTPLTKLARRHALSVSDSRFKYDVGRLVETIDKVLAGKSTRVAIEEVGQEHERDAASAGGQRRLAGAAAAPDRVVPAESDGGAGQARTASRLGIASVALGCIGLGVFPGVPAMIAGWRLRTRTWAPEEEPEAQRTKASTAIWAGALGSVLTVVVWAVAVVSLTGKDPGSPPSGSDSIPKPVEPLSVVVSRFERAMATGNCAQIAGLVNLLARPNGTAPGGPPRRGECPALERIYSQLRGFRAGPQRVMGTGGVVDGTVGNQSVSTLWIVDADLRWRHDWRGDFFGTAPELSRPPPPENAFDANARAFVAAVRQRQCHTEFSLYNPRSGLLRPGGEQGYCSKALYDTPYTVFSAIVNNPSIRPQLLGKTRSMAFYALVFPRSYWTLVLARIYSPSPTDSRMHTEWGILNAYPGPAG